MFKKLAVVTFSALALAGCLPGSTKQTTVAPETQTQAGAMSEFAQMGAAIAAGKPVECAMKSKDGSIANYQIKGKKMKVTGLGGSENPNGGSMLSDGTYMYTWDDVKKTGMKIKLPTEQEMKDAADKYQDENTAPDFSDETEQKKYEEMGYTVNCEEKSLDESVFVPPTDVKFTDYSEVMEQTNKMMQQGAGENGQPSQEQIEELMKKYGQQ